MAGNGGVSTDGLNVLEGLYNTALYYAQQADQVAAAKGVPLTVAGIVTNLDFKRGSGAQLAAGSISWGAYASQLEASVTGVVEFQQSLGMDASPVIDWWSNVAAKQLQRMSVTEPVGSLVAPVVAAADTALTSYGLPIAGVIIAVLVLIVVIHVT